MLRSVLLRAIGFVSSVALATVSYAADWRPVSAAELADSAPKIVEGAPAEVLYWSVKMDDGDYPEFRTITQYIRYKIYDPAKSVDLTRVSEISASYDGTDTVDESKLAARLILPDGTTKEFGKESIQTRSVLHQGDEGFFGKMFGSATDVSQKFLAVPGIQPGSVLEFQTKTTLNGHVRSRTLFTRLLQKHDIGVRHVEYLQIFPSSDYVPTPFVRNGAQFHAVVNFKKGDGRFTVVADNLPPLYREPYSPPELDDALAIDGTYVWTHETIMSHHPEDQFRDNSTVSKGPWGAVATKAAMVENDVIHDSASYSKAKELVAGATTDLEKAERIHRYVHQLFILWSSSPTSKVSHLTYYYSCLPSEVIDFKDHANAAIQTTDFSILALSLYRAAGLKADEVLLPNNNYSTFSERMVADGLLPERCVRVMVDGKWLFSMPQVFKPLPLGELPARNRGTEGLVVEIGKTEFIPIDDMPAEDSVIRNEGDLTLTPDGRLTGMCKRTLTGECAFLSRPQSQAIDEARFGRQWGRRLRAELKADELTVTDVSGMSEPNSPLTLTYTVSWNNYATVFKSHLAFAQSVFGSRTNPLFSSDTRHNDLQFPFHYQQVDDVTIHMPEGYTLESPSAPISVPGRALSVLFEVGYKKNLNELVFKRTFTSNLTYVPVARYPELKHWFDVVSKGENHELVLSKPAAAAPVAAPAAVPTESPAAAPAPAAESKSS